MKITDIITEAELGTSPKREKRAGSRPDRGHEPQKRYVTDRKTGKQYDPDEEFNKTMNSPEVMAQMKRMATKEGADDRKQNALWAQITQHEKQAKATKNDIKKQHHMKMADELRSQLKTSDLDENKAPRSLCLSSKPDEDLGASQLSSCKSQGLRARDGNKSHKLGKSPKSRVKVGGKRIKGNKYGGPLPDWS